MGAMASFMIEVRGTPRPQPRPRFVGGRVVATADDKAALWRKAVARAARQAVAGSCFPAGAVCVDMVFRFRPTGRQAIGTPHTRRPDSDNLAKLALDALTDAGVFGDDCVVATLNVRKIWMPGAGVIISIRPAETVIVPGNGELQARPDWLAHP